MTDAPQRSTFSRILRAGVTLLGTTAVVALAAGLVIGGSDLISARAINTPTVQVPAPVSVQTARFTLQESYEVPVQFLGQVEARRDVSLSFETGGTVTDVSVDEGAQVHKGQVIATLDTRLLEAGKAQQEATLAALQAQLDLANSTLARQAELNKRGVASTQVFDETRFRAEELIANIAATRAAILSTEISIEKSVIKAPFAGRVAARFIDEGAALGAGQPVVQILEEGPTQIRVGVTPAFTKSPLEVYEISIAGQSFPATLFSIRPDIDPATRTVTALFTIESDMNFALGELATLSGARQIDERGGWVPISTLQEGTSGLWSILVLTADDTIAREAVELIYANETQAYVRGSMPNGARFVTDGAHRVTLGQAVAMAGTAQ